MMFLRRWRATGARVVPLGMRHAGDIADLHSRGFARAWSTTEVEALMAGRGVFALGIRLGSAVLGMVLVRVAADEAEILTIAIDPDWRGCSLSRRLLGHALDRAAGARARKCFLEVDAGNAPAVGLYRSLGFAEVGRRKGYYRGEGGGDALVLARDLADRIPSMPPPDAVEIDPGRD